MHVICSIDSRRLKAHTKKLYTYYENENCEFELSWEEYSHKRDPENKNVRVIFFPLFSAKMLLFMNLFKTNRRKNNNNKIMLSFFRMIGGRWEESLGL